jgi:hypothetical protein
MPEESSSADSAALCEAGSPSGGKTISRRAAEGAEKNLASMFRNLRNLKNGRVPLCVLCGSA